MLSNFLRKPLGIVTIMGAAVGGPYAAFETDVGRQLRQSFVSRMAQTPNAQEPNYGPSNDASSDPYSLLAANSPSGSPYVTASQTSSWPHNGGNSPRNNFPAGVPQAGTTHIASNGQVISTVFGTATIQPMGPPTPQQQASMQAIPSYPNGSSLPGPYLETRSGPAVAVPGKTDQLWDYTLGTPTLSQIQQQPNTTVGGGVVYDLREVLRFDIVPGWLPQRFARVSTVTSNVQMDGLRVPLITGTQPKDIAGTLTYYFDSSQTLKRINLHGLTGDPTQLANLMVQFYQLKPEQSLGGQLFTTRWNNRITSVMQISPAPIIYAGADHSKYIIFLELNQPTNQYGLSDEASEVLRNSQATQRW